MTQLLPGIRNAVRALIVHEEHVLLLRKCHGDNDEYYALPGGAQEEGESLVDALQRECEEEIGSTISIGELLLVADYTKQRRSDPPSRRQLVEFLFYRSVRSIFQNRMQLSGIWPKNQNLFPLIVSRERRYCNGCSLNSIATNLI